MGKIALLLLLIPLVGITVVYFGKFHPTGKKEEDVRKGSEPESKEVPELKEPPHPEDIAKAMVKQEEKPPAQAMPKEQQEQAEKQPPAQPPQKSDDSHFEEKLNQHIKEEEEELKKWFGK